MATPRTGPRALGLATRRGARRRHGARSRRRIDFVGVNYYCRDIVRSPLPPVARRASAGTERTAMGWEVYPAGLTRDRSSSSRPGPAHCPLYVTENGAAYAVDDIDPTRRYRARRASSSATSRPPARRSSTACRSVATSSGRCSTTSNGRTATGTGSGSSTSTSTRWSARSATAAVPGAGLPRRAPLARASPSVSLRYAPKLDRTGRSPVRAGLAPPTPSVRLALCG